MSTTLEYASYLIRLWREQNAQAFNPPINWQVEVEHIQSGKHWSLDSFEDLVLFLRQQVGELDLLKDKAGSDSQKTAC